MVARSKETLAVVRVALERVYRDHSATSKSDLYRTVAVSRWASDFEKSYNGTKVKAREGHRRGEFLFARVLHTSIGMIVATRA